MTDPRYEPQGAPFQSDGIVIWRVWAPLADQVTLVLNPEAERREIAMTSEPFGFHACQQTHVGEGARYTFNLGDGNGDGKEYPDPASRWQPDGVHGPSAIFNPANFAWTDAQWRGVPREDLVFYELHVGTFAPEGTFDAIIPRLSDLVALGITAIELMPITQFPGERNWGYDGVYPYAVQNSYGGPHALQRLIDVAHAHGLAIFIDVVYNHLGPEGCYFNQFGHYFTDHYHTPWGTAINFGDAYSDPVRQFFIDNAVMWIRDFHADGLRLDAIHAIYDASALHILAEIGAAVHRAGKQQNRLVHVVAESNRNDVRVVNSLERGGHGLDAAWSDDFHHAVHALLTGERDGYYQDFGEAEHLVKALNEVYVYDGAHSPFRRRRHGNRVGATDRTQFVVALQNHDQIGNRAMGDRLSTLLPPASQRLAAGLMLLSPFLPLLFMGEEYGETRPFPFFCSFGDTDLVEAIRKGRQREFADLAFKWHHAIPDAQDPATFASAKLQWSWPDGSDQAKRRQLYRDLLAARRERAELRAGQPLHAELLNRVIVIRRGEAPGLVIYANLTAEGTETPPHETITARQTFSMPAEQAALPSIEPPWAPQQGAAVVERLAAAPARVPLKAVAPILLSTEDARYGGTRRTGDSLDHLLPYELLITDPTQWRK